MWCITSPPVNFFFKSDGISIPPASRTSNPMDRGSIKSLVLRNEDNMEPAWTVSRLYGSSPRATDGANSFKGTWSHGLATFKNQIGVNGNSIRNRSR
ncbi:hypothetical protein PsorP6_000720 [Peronosclerospora sorghi]|uniref:Uncharacterized protein n=1 Tax=Peronosclerospora sorghi TaxID=230839 RepID=A0ACC0WYH8_9STRA|nr:hypothetical protein PsorP6_000720 [Peronosclerospora sorghi]